MRIKAGGREAGGGDREGEKKKERRRQEDKKRVMSYVTAPEEGLQAGGRVEPLVKGGKQGGRYGGI